MYMATHQLVFPTLTQLLVSHIAIDLKNNPFPSDILLLKWIHDLNIFYSPTKIF